MAAAAAQVNRDHPAWLVDRDGNFNANIEQDLNLVHEKCAAVSIIGVQSTGKSTLLNKCFSTNFEEMDESQGVRQTTKGIWIAKCPISNGGPKILVIDTEGSDSSERGREGNDSDEKKIAFFALATSNTVIFNMKCANVALHHGGGRPLFQTVFQVMLGKIRTPRQVNLVFVLRDKNKSPLEALKKQLRQVLDEIWRGMSRSEANRNATLEDYFKIEVMTMSHYDHQREQFDKEVKSVRNRIFSLVKLGQPLPAKAFLALAKTNWEEIRGNKILDLNLNKITVDRVHCHDTMEKKRLEFLQDKSWLQIESDVQSATIERGFGKRVNSIMDKYLSQYNEETLYADTSPRNDYMNQLIQNLSTVVEPSYFVLVANLRKATSENFQEEIAKVIKKRGKFEALNSKNFITKFKHHLGDAEVQLAKWNHTPKQSEEMQSELGTYEDGARRVIEILETEEKNKALMWTGATMFTAQAMGYSAALGSAILLGPGAVVSAGAVAMALGASVPLPIASITTFITAFCKYQETKKDMKEARKQNDAIEGIMRKTEKS